MPESFARDFMITHFFNPPRYMRLLELVTGPHRPGAWRRWREFCRRDAGQVRRACKDAPGFIANRVGNYWMQVAVSARRWSAA